MSPTRFPSSIRLFCAALLVASSCARADEESPALDRVSIWLGGYSLDTTVAINASAGNISTGKVNLESGREDVARARVDFLFLGSQGFSFDYYSLGHTTTQTLNRPFIYEGLPFQLDSTLRGKLDLDAGSASYHWWFGSTNDVVGLGIGGTYYKVKLGLDGTVTLNGTSAEGSTSWEDDAVAPLITVAYKHAFSDSFRAYIDASGVKKDGGRLGGHIYDGRVGIEWFPWQNFGVGAEYGMTRIHLDHDGDSYNANLDIKLDGPSLFARARF